MANKIVLKKSSVTTKVPLTTDLEYGELALNYADGKLYYKDSSNLIKAFSSASSGGGSSVPVVISATAPFGVDEGTLWWNSEEANMYVLYNDGDSTQWVTAARGVKGDKGDTGSGVTGGGSDEVFIQNDQVVTTNYTIPVGKNAMSTGPITVDTGVSVTVSSGSRWVVI